MGGKGGMWEGGGDDLQQPPRGRHTRLVLIFFSCYLAFFLEDFYVSFQVLLFITINFFL